MNQIDDLRSVVKKNQYIAQDIMPQRDQLLKTKEMDLDRLKQQLEDKHKELIDFSNDFQRLCNRLGSFN